MGVYYVGDDVAAGFAAAQEVWGALPTAITGLQVAKLGVPGAIVEIEVTAFLPAE